VAYGALIGEGKVAEVFEYGDGKVLKLYRAGQPASDARREFGILDVVEAAGVAAPRAFDLEQVDERWGLVMSYVAGQPFAGQGPISRRWRGCKRPFMPLPGRRLRRSGCGWRARSRVRA
jgi:hypothetical protein